MNYSLQYVNLHNESEDSSSTFTPEQNKWLLDPQLLGPIIATIVAIEFVLSLCANLFISIYTIFNAKKALRKSSTILLFNLALSNLLLAVFYMPFVIVATAASEWVIGRTDSERECFCRFTGFVFSYSTSVSMYVLAAISFDRFLFIVKPQIHDRWMTWKVTLGIVTFIWLLGIILSVEPYYGIGEYGWAPFIGGCLPLWRNNRGYVILSSAAATIPIVIIVITSAWTFIFTRWFLKKNLQRLKRNLTKQNLEIHKSIYTERLKNLFGIFSLLFFLNILSWSPFLIAAFTGLVVGIETLPPQVYTCVFIMFMLMNVTNSLVQGYFRKDLLECVKSWKVACVKCCTTCCRHDEQEVHAISSQKDEVRMPNGGETNMVDSHEENPCERRVEAESYDGRVQSHSTREESCDRRVESRGVSTQIPAESDVEWVESLSPMAENGSMQISVTIECEGISGDCLYEERSTGDDHVTCLEDYVTQCEDHAMHHVINLKDISSCDPPRGSCDHV